MQLWDVVEVGEWMPGHPQGLWTQSVGTVCLVGCPPCASQCGNWDGKRVSKATWLVAVTVTGLSPRTLMAHKWVLIGETLLSPPAPIKTRAQDGKRCAEATREELARHLEQGATWGGLL